MSDNWILRPRAVASPSVRLICIPHAGGTTGLYRQWPRLLPQDVEVVLICLPGRDRRIAETIPTDLATLVEDLTDALQPQLNGGPFAIFGHSMGGMIGHELALSLLRRGVAPPKLFIPSARQPPQYGRPGDFHLRSDPELCAEILRLGGTPAEAFADAELRDMVLPRIRADYRLVETYVAPAPVRLPCPIVPFLGMEDSEVSSSEAEGWAQWTSRSSHRRMFPGGHFYLAPDATAVTDAVTDLLASASRNGRRR